MMKVIGLTGGAGSGKSTIADMIARNFNVYLINTDAIAKEQMLRGGHSYQGVVEEFGNEILGADNEIDRGILAGIVFRNRNKLLRLNELTHPQVLVEVHEIIQRVRNEGKYQAVFVETALLQEAGYVSFCDEVWYVYAPAIVRRERLRISRGYTDAKIDAVFSKQKTEEGFQGYCTHIIQNLDGMSEKDIINQISHLL